MKDPLLRAQRRIRPLRLEQPWQCALLSVFVGRHIGDPSLRDVWADTPFIFDGRSTASGQINEYSRVEMIAAYLGTQTRYATDEELAAYAAEFDAMPCYPDDGAIRLMDGTLYIKLCDPSYTSFD